MQHASLLFSCWSCCLYKQLALQTPTSPHPSALSELMMGTAGCEPQLQACDSSRGTAYWGTLPADESHYRQTLLIRLMIVMILCDRDLFFSHKTELPCALAHQRMEDFVSFCQSVWRWQVLLHTGYKTTPSLPKTHLWHTTCTRYDSQNIRSHIVYGGSLC